jgi:C-terminal processing protease CtpA/Prc
MDLNIPDETSSMGTLKTLDKLHSRDPASYFSNVDPDILDIEMIDVPATSTGRTGFIEDLFESGDGEYSISLDSLKTSSETDNGSFINKSETSSDRISTLSVSRVKRDCIAPPGKLSIVIETSGNGPVIHQVKPRSPLENILFAGDRIIKIDNFDTSRMTASEVTRIMSQTIGSRRKITVLSSIIEKN